MSVCWLQMSFQKKFNIFVQHQYLNTLVHNLFSKQVQCLSKYTINTTWFSRAVLANRGDITLHFRDLQRVLRVRASMESLEHFIYLSNWNVDYLLSEQQSFILSRIQATDWIGESF